MTLLKITWGKDKRLSPPRVKKELLVGWSEQCRTNRNSRGCTYSPAIVKVVNTSTQYMCKKFSISIVLLNSDL
jgi:hypothetical protein